MTIEGWVNPTANGSGGNVWRTMVMKEGANDLAWALYPFGSGGFASGHVFTSASEAWARGTSALVLNAWTHVATTYDGTTVRMFRQRRAGRDGGRQDRDALLDHAAAAVRRQRDLVRVVQGPTG